MKKILTRMVCTFIASLMLTTSVTALIDGYWQDSKKYYYNYVMVAGTKFVVDDKLYQFSKFGDSVVIADVYMYWNPGNTLNSSIAKKLGKNEEELTSEDYARIFGINLYNMDTLSATDAKELEATLKKLPNLTQLDARDSKLTAAQLKLFANRKTITEIKTEIDSTCYDNLSLFKANLTTLTVRGSPLQYVKPDYIQPDLKQLSTLTKLRNLTFNFGITDISALSNLKSLVTLDLGSNRITSIKPLEGLTNLRSLSIHNNGIKSLTSVGKLTNLEALMIQRNPITDIKPVAKLTKLRYFDMIGCEIEDLSPLSELTSLQYLYAYNNYKNSDYSPLAKLTNMIEISTDTILTAEKSSLSAFSGMIYLKDINIGSPHLEKHDYDVLNDLPIIKEYGSYGNYYYTWHSDEDDDGSSYGYYPRER